MIHKTNVIMEGEGKALSTVFNKSSWHLDALDARNLLAGLILPLSDYFTLS